MERSWGFLNEGEDTKGEASLNGGDLCSSVQGSEGHEALGKQLCLAGLQMSVSGES